MLMPDLNGAIRKLSILDEMMIAYTSPCEPLVRHHQTPKHGDASLFRCNITVVRATKYLFLRCIHERCWISWRGIRMGEECPLSMLHSSGCKQVRRRCTYTAKDSCSNCHCYEEEKDISIPSVKSIDTRNHDGFGLSSSRKQETRSITYLYQSPGQQRGPLRWSCWEEYTW